MGPISAALKSCVKPFDRSMYVATILQAWQTCSSSPLSIVVYLLLVLVAAPAHAEWDTGNTGTGWRSEEHTSELQSLMRISYAVFCLKKKKKKQNKINYTLQLTQQIATTIKKKIET